MEAEGSGTSFSMSSLLIRGSSCYCLMADTLLVLSGDPLSIGDGSVLIFASCGPLKKDILFDLLTDWRPR